MTATFVEPTLRERRIARRLEYARDPRLVDELVKLRSLVVGGRYRVESLHAVGGEGAVYLLSDFRDPSAPLHVGKIPVLPYDRPAQMDTRLLRKHRENLRTEARYLASGRSRSLPDYHCVLEFVNPLLDPVRGGAFAEAEAMLVMERLPGTDLDRWLARVHRTRVPRPVVRRTLDRVSVMILQALVELLDNGFVYADLRPGNVRILGRPDRSIRLLDAGSLVEVTDRSGRFPHVPAYLPPALYEEVNAGRPIVPDARVQTLMAGRTLFEVATGRTPWPGREVDVSLLRDSAVSEPVAKVVEKLCVGEYADVSRALRELGASAKRRVAGGNVPLRSRPAPAPAATSSAGDAPRSRLRAAFEFAGSVLSAIRWGLARVVGG